MMSTGDLKIGPAAKQVALGTALWGWGVDKQEAFEILDHFVESGGTLVDVATNYPINGVPADYGLSLEYLSEWIRSRQHDDLRIILKLGARDNVGSSRFDLSRDRILDLVERAHRKLGESLSCVSVHWDNRGESQEEHTGIQATAKALSELEAEGFDIGLSGIKRPEIYKKFLEIRLERLLIQVKENLLTHAARDNYERVFPDSRYLAYGLNMGGLKTDQYKRESSKTLRNINHPEWLVDSVKTFLTQNNLSPKVNSVSDLTLFHAFCNDRLSGIILGPRTKAQLKDALAFWNKLLEVRPRSTSRKIESMVFGV